ncbi:hypothetical protein V6N13_086811 [Hibiscus sabdariffa]|uniref:Histone H3 K4-specific methyltransferase SET7/9 family protein n=1 Tax=Hibiscus sabdariffa TaxID=183260 RepID=A0ABR2FUL4_9ROSI
MHQKKSEVQIGTESCGVSSDFNPKPSAVRFYHNNFPPHQLQQFNYHHCLNRLPDTTSAKTTSVSVFPQIVVHSPPQDDGTAPAPSPTLTPAPYKRPLLTQTPSLSRTPTLYRFTTPPHFTFAFSAALLFSLNLAAPRLPYIRLFLSRSFPIKLKSSSPLSRSHFPVFWSIGTRSKSEKRANSGCWVQVYSNGDVYEGEFHKGKCSGSGVYYYYMSGRYEGDWVDGKYDGYGVETWARGSRGMAVEFIPVRMEVDMLGNSNGESSMDSDITILGTEIHMPGNILQTRCMGLASIIFANGHRYDSAWHEGRRQGLGVYMFRNGETQSGNWQNGILNVPSTQSSTYPVLPVAVYHSKVLNAVQEARRAAEKAYDVTKVDERVNKAVAAGNRAANAARVIAVKAVQKQMHH